MARPRLPAVAAGALALAVACGLIYSRSGSAHAPDLEDARAAAPVAHPPKNASASPARAAPRPETASAEADSAPPGDLPASLSGTDVDGGLDVGPDGHLLLGPRALALFDYFLSASGEESEAAIRARIEAHARAYLTEPALGEALDLLDRYMAYREAGRTLRVPEGAGAAARLEAVRELRRKHFGDDAAALFGDDERAAEVAIAKSEVLQDPSVSPEDREDLLAAQEARLPASARQARSKATSALDLRADEAALRADGADDDVIRRYRESKLGPEAADRLEALDRDRAAFKARVASFREERDRACSGAADPASCEATLMEKSFDERERIRVRALLSMH